MPHTTPISCWVISDGRRGIENQALGLAQAAAQIQPMKISKHVIRHRSLFSALPPKIQSAIKPNTGNYGLSAPYPKLAIGCGRQAIAPLLALKKTLRSDIFTVYVQNPRIKTAAFNLVIAPVHDTLGGANIETMIGSPNRITKEILNNQVQNFIERLKTIPSPRAAVLIGGPSKTHTLTPDNHQLHLQHIHALLDKNISVLISTSRRTPQWAQQDYKNIAKKNAHVWYWAGDGSDIGENPYFAFLGSADAILVTQDSTNMLTEACASGKPVFFLPMQGRSRKFTVLYKDLKTRCNLAPFSGDITANDYDPLQETKRVATILLQKLNSEQTKS